MSEAAGAGHTDDGVPTVNRLGRLPGPSAFPEQPPATPDAPRRTPRGGSRSRGPGAAVPSRPAPRLPGPLSAAQEPAVGTASVPSPL